MKLTTYQHKDYSGGLNDTADDKEIARHEASFLENWDITKKGKLVKRDGLTQSGDTLSNKIDGLGAFYRKATSPDILCVEGGTLRYLNSTTWDSLDTGFTSGKITDFETCPVNDKVYITNQTDNTHSWDRASVVENSSLTDLGATIPHGDAIRWHKNHMWITGNAAISSTTHKNRIYWSALGDPDTWDTTNDFIDVPGQGNMVTMADMGDALVLFKQRSISILTGWGDTDWRITASSSNTANFDESIGIAGPYAHTRVGNEVWFMDDEGVIRRLYQTDFDAFRRDVISTKIEGTIGNLNKSQLANVVATTWNDKVYFAVPDGASTVNNLVLVYDILASKRTSSEAWVKYTGWNVNRFLTYETTDIPDLYVGDAVLGKIYTHEGDEDDGSSIDSRWDGKQDDYGYPSRLKIIKFGYISGPNSGDIDVEVHASVNGSTYADLGDLNLSGSGSHLGPTGSFLLGPTGDCTLGGLEDVFFKYYLTDGGGTASAKSVKMSIRHNVINEQPIVESFTNHFKLRKLR